MTRSDRRPRTRCASRTAAPDTGTGAGRTPTPLVCRRSADPAPWFGCDHSRQRELRTRTPPQTRTGLNCQPPLTVVRHLAAHDQLGHADERGRVIDTVNIGQGSPSEDVRHLQNGEALGRAGGPQSTGTRHHTHPRFIAESQFSIASKHTRSSILGLWQSSGVSWSGLGNNDSTRSPPSRRVCARCTTVQGRRRSSLRRILPAALLGMASTTSRCLICL